MDTTRTFDKIVDALARKPRYLENVGGTRSGKTFAELQLLVYLVERDPFPSVNSIVSESLPHLKLGAIADFKVILKSDNKWDERRWNATENFYTFPNGAVIQFFEARNIGKALGPARDRLLIIEANHIAWEIAQQLMARTRDMVWWDYNPAAPFWATEQFADEPRIERTHSTYLDNDFLTESQVYDIERNKRDPRWWRVYGLGLMGQLEGVIYNFTQIDEMPDPHGLVEVYGMDFGYTNDPSTLVRVLADTRRKVLYIDEVLYRTHMLNSDIIAFMRENNISRTTEIFADCAEPKSVDEIAYAGFNCKPCYKGREIVEQIQFVQGYEMRITTRSINTIREARNYAWLKDKDGRTLNAPNKGEHFDHALDALRYAVFTKLGTFKRPLKGGKPRTANAW